MRRVVSVCLGALASLLVIGIAHATAQEEPPPTTVATTTTLAPVTTGAIAPSTTTTTTKTTTTVRGATTTVANGGRPVPPPAAGPTQTLVPDLLGTPVEIATTTTSIAASPFEELNRGTLPTNATIPVATASDSPSGITLLLAAVAWLASFGGVLVYAEEKRAANWKHLAR